MKRLANRWIKLFGVFGGIGLGGCLSAFDIPVRYHAPAFQGTPAQITDDWAFDVQLRYRTGNTRYSENTNSERTSLFNDHGPFNIAALGTNVEDRGILLKKYWPDPSMPDHTKLFMNKGEAVFGDFLCNKKCAGVVEFSGKYKIHSFDIIWRQNLLWGLFAHLYLPIKDVELGSICYQYCAAKPEDRDADVVSFLEKDLDNLLAERGLKPIGTPFKKSGFADPVLSFGWQGQTSEKLGIIDELKGMVMCGVLFPWGAASKKDHVFSLPMGHNHHWGVNLRAHIEAGLWSLFTVGASVGVLSLLNRTTSMRLKTDKRQNGWILLQKALTNEDAGSVWDLSGYVAVGPEVYGVTGLFGFSFVRQECFDLHVRDECFLKALRDSSITDAETGNKGQIVAPDDIVNSEARLKEWEMYIFHFHLGYDMKGHVKCACVPRFTFHYDYPFIGKHTFVTEMFGGSVGVSCSFDF